MPEPTIKDHRTIVAAWLEAARATGEKDAYHSKRKELRAEWFEQLELRVGSEILYVQAHDISEQGVGLVCRHQLKIGTEVHVRRNPEEMWIRCRVIHTTQTIGSYKIGVELQFEFDGA